MRQAIMTSPGIIEYREIPKPESLESMEVLLKIERIGVCGSDIHVFHGEHPATPYPVVQISVGDGYVEFPTEAGQRIWNTNCTFRRLTG